VARSPEVTNDGEYAMVTHLRAAWVSVVVDSSVGVAWIRHWGSDLGEILPGSVGDALAMPVAVGALDLVAPLTVVPCHGDGFSGPPGLEVHRGDGSSWAPRFVTTTVQRPDNHTVATTSVDEIAALRLVTTIRLDRHGALCVVAELTNAGDDILWLNAFDVALPVSADAGELVSFGGRWSNEYQLDRRPWPPGSSMFETRLGRTSHEAPPLVMVGSDGFGEWTGDVWMAHLAWSGNHRIGAVRLPDGRRYISGSDLLHPGEISLSPGESFTTPPLIGSFSDRGIGEASRRFHRLVRAMPHMAATRSSPRPVSLNTWEAVYFDHDGDRLRALADRAAAVGVERFVLDDGWFGARRHDRAGLGDWTVSSDVHPDGLGPLIDHVRALGMTFGIWVEPEMVNEDSNLFRAHPDWVLETPGYPRVSGRGQMVLDLGRPEAFEHVLGQLDALLSNHAIEYVKWDHNRPLVQGSGHDRRSGAHRQTVAFYALVDELRSRHAGVEFESCSGGGGRIDLGVLSRTERVWVSDCNDPIDRQRIQRAMSLLIPPEVMGCHIGPATAHTTGRTHPLAFRAATAFFGHLGIEWNLLECDDDELARLASIVAMHKTHRSLLHGGDTVRFDPSDDAGLAGGVYSSDRREALISYARMTSGASLTPAPLRLPGLIPDALYQIEHLSFPGETWGMALSHPSWPTTGLSLTGAQLAAHGLQLPVLLPERAFVFHLLAQ